jgi:hypothetical protein
LTDRYLAAANHPKSPPNRRCRWLVVYGGYAAFDSSPPAIIVVAKADFLIVAHHPRKASTEAVDYRADVGVKDGGLA